MRERAKTFLAGVETTRTVAVGQTGEYPQLIVRMIDRMAPVIADMIESEPDACPHCLALVLEKFVISPASAALTVGFSQRARGEALREIVEIKSLALGFKCVEATNDAAPSSLSGGLH